MEKIKLNANKNNIKNLIVTTITLILLLVLLLGIGLSKKDANGVTTYIRGFNNSATSLTGIYSDCALIIIICGSLALVMSLIGLFVPQEMTKTKMIMDALTKLMMLLIIILSIVIIAKFADDVKTQKQTVTTFTYCFMIIFGIVMPLAAVIINFDKTIYIKKVK